MTAPVQGLEARETMVAWRRWFRRAGPFMLGAGVIVVGGVWRLSDDLVVTALALFVMLTLGLLALAAQRRKASRSSERPAELSLHADGLHDRRVKLSIPWADVQEIRLWKQDVRLGKGQETSASALFIVLRNPKPYLAQVSFWWRMLFLLNKLFYRVDVSVDLSRLDVGSNEVERVARQLWQADRMAR